MSVPTCRRDGCPQHGHTHPHCAAHSRAGTPCRNHPLPGQHVCRMHGGTSPQAQAAAAIRIQDDAARRELSILGEPTPVDPSTALLDLISWKHAEVLAIRGRVTELDDTAVVWGVTTKVDKRAGEFPGTDTTSAAEVNVWVRLLHQCEDQLAAYAAAAHRAGIAEREVRVAEQQGQMVATAMRRALDGIYRALVAAGLAEALQVQWPVLVGEIIPRELRALAGSSTP